MEVISDFAFPLASFVIANIIGVPEEDREQLKEWASRVSFKRLILPGQERH